MEEDNAVKDSNSMKLKWSTHLLLKLYSNTTIINKSRLFVPIILKILLRIILLQLLLFNFHMFSKTYSNFKLVNFFYQLRLILIQLIVFKSKNKANDQRKLQKLEQMKELLNTLVEISMKVNLNFLKSR